MGCKHSKNINGELYNQDVDVKRRFMTGVHISRGPDGIEGNVQVALGIVKHKKYERVAPTLTTIEEEDEPQAIEEN